MSWETFLKSLYLASETTAMITLGGGEPTIWPFFGQAIDYLKDNLIYGTLRGIEQCLVITNGTRYRNTMKAVRVMERFEEIYLGEPEEYKFQIVMSDPYDGFHDQGKVNWTLYDYFNNRDKGRKEGIRKINSVIKAGRGKSLAEYSVLDRGLNFRDDCPCPTLFIKPDGDIYQCGCEDSPKIGSVFDDHEIFEEVEWNDCHKEIEKRRRDETEKR